MAESTPNHKSASFAFDKLEQFSLKEVLDNQGYIFLDIRGIITLKSSPPSQDAAIVANVSMTTHNIEIESTNFDSTPTSLTIGNPELKNRSYFRRPAITLDITVHVKPSIDLSTFEIDTHHLHIEIDPSLSLTVSEKSILAAKSGHVNSPAAPEEWHSRKKYISSISGGIRGEYALEDVLSCTTSSGGIRIGVIPKEAGKEDAPAAFTAKSASGHNDVQFRTFGAPDREYMVDVQTASGGMTGTYIHGLRTRIESQSGGKRVTLVPFGGEGSSELTTEGMSGSSDITVLAPLKMGKTLGAMRSTHRSVSGSLRINYPREWAGRFEGSSVSGSLSAAGPGLEVERGGEPGLKRVSGRSKVEGLAELSFSSVSGSARLDVG
jgi:hypothetical protein